MEHALKNVYKVLFNKAKNNMDIKKSASLISLSASKERRLGRLDYTCRERARFGFGGKV